MAGIKSTRTQDETTNYQSTMSTMFHSYNGDNRAAAVLSGQAVPPTAAQCPSCGGHGHGRCGGDVAALD